MTDRGSWAVALDQGSGGEARAKSWLRAEPRLEPGPPHASISPTFMNCTSCLRSVVPWDKLGSGGPLQVRAALGFGWPEPQGTVR